jgi:lipopolysaccharide export system permease protein
MRVLDRYLVKGFVGPFLHCLFLFTALFVIIDAFNKLDEFLKNSVPLGIIATYYAYSLPALVSNVVPISVLVAVLYKLSSLNKSHEIVALRASGLSALHVLMPYLFTGVVLSFFVFVVNENVVPRAAVTSTAIKEGLIESGKKSLEERSIKNVTLKVGNRMIFAREYEIPTRTLYDVVILQETPRQGMISKLDAKKARYEDGQWTFHDVRRYDMNRRGEIVGERDHSEKLAFDFPEKPDDFVRGAAEAEFMSAGQLKKYIAELAETSPGSLQRLRVDFHAKIAFPFVSFVVMLLGAPLAMRTERGSAFVGIGTAFVIVTLYYALNSVSLAMGKGGHLPAIVSAWLANALFAAAGVWLLRRVS